jgi:ADP-ribosylglycohydrolase
MRNKIKGMILGTAVGDSLGMPVETWGRERILKQYPNGITKYEKPDGHKWFKDEESGTITDDTQLTMAVMRGMIRGNGFNMDKIALAHIGAMLETTSGWGNTTRESIRRLANGVSYTDSGKFASDGQVRGVGNGVIMKLAPLAAWRVSPHGVEEGFFQKVVDFSAMTHYTKKSAYASVVHSQILTNCLLKDKNTYNLENDLFNEIPYLFDLFWDAFAGGQSIYTSHLYEYDEEECIESVLGELEEVPDMSFEDISNKFKGTCYVYESLPYTYAHWIKNHTTIETLYDSINYGGDRNDSDSNASMLGAMLGALHGVEIFESEPHLIKGLKIYDQLMRLTDDFCDHFEID